MEKAGESSRPEHGILPGGKQDFFGKILLFLKLKRQIKGVLVPKHGTLLECPQGSSVGQGQGYCIESPSSGVTFLISPFGFTACFLWLLPQIYQLYILKNGEFRA